MATTETEFRSRSISEKVVTEFHFFDTSPAILNMEWLFVWPLYYVWHHHQQDSRTVASARHRQEIRKIYKWRPDASINGGNEFLLIMTCTIQWPEVVRLAYMAKVDIIFSLDFHHINLFRNHLYLHIVSDVPLFRANIQ